MPRPVATQQRRVNVTQRRCSQQERFLRQLIAWAETVGIWQAENTVPYMVLTLGAIQYPNRTRYMLTLYRDMSMVFGTVNDLTLANRDNPDFWEYLRQTPLSTLVAAADEFARKRGVQHFVFDPRQPIDTESDQTPD